MNKMMSLHMQHVFLTSIMLVILTACGAITPTIAPTLQPPTAAPPYIHYTPSEISNVHLEFDYPGSWIFSEDKIQGTDIISIGLGDPRLLTVPTRAPEEPHGTPSDFGSINILVQPANPGQTLDTRIEAHKKGHSDVSWIIQRCLKEIYSLLSKIKYIKLHFQLQKKNAAANLRKDMSISSIA